MTRVHIVQQMNTITVEPNPQPPQPHRSSFACDRHPQEHFTGFCPSCLCERLTTLDQSSASSSRRPSTSSSTTAAALRAVFKLPTTSADPSNKIKNKHSFLPELRRTQSFSASKNEGFSGVFEPQRKSCDVRVRNTLWTLFSIDDEDEPVQNNHSISNENTNLGVQQEEDEDDDEIRVLEEPIVINVNAVEGTAEEDLKAIKDHIDLDSQTKKMSGMDLKEIAGSFWSAASVFSKRWQKWRRKQKVKKRRSGGRSSALPVEKPASRQIRETQSEVADYGFGRRSCDTDPRFSLDAGRMSLDAGRMSLDAGRMSFEDPRYSFEEPRASWDGYLIGRTFPRLPPMVSLVEDSPPVRVLRSDTQIPVEDPMNIPGGTEQTKEYYSDSSSKRRKSLDRSGSIRKTAAAVVAEMDEMKVVSNAKVTPATMDYFNGAKLLGGDRDTRDSNSNSLRDDCSETFELGFRDNASVLGNSDRKGLKKSRRWGWSIWGFIHRRSLNKEEDEDQRYSSRGNGVERSYSESWQDKRGFNQKVLRSNSSVSWRSSYNGGGSFGSARKSSTEMNGHKKKKRDEFVLERNRSAKKDDFVLERNRSARYSPNHIDKGLLRFYLTPLRSSRRSGSGKNRPNHSHSFARSVLRMY